MPHAQAISCEQKEEDPNKEEEFSCKEKSISNEEEEDPYQEKGYPREEKSTSHEEEDSDPQAQEFAGLLYPIKFSVTGCKAGSKQWRVRSNRMKVGDRPTSKHMRERSLFV